MKSTEQKDAITILKDEGEKIAVIANSTIIGLLVDFVMNNGKPHSLYNTIPVK